MFDEIGAGGAILLIFIGAVWWILGIILFFKVWFMTNDVRKIRDAVEEWFDKEHPLITNDKESYDYDNK